MEAVRTFVRYDMPDENGETRRERHKRFHQPDPPTASPPHEVAHLWDWFWALSNRRQSGPEPLAFAEIEAWSRMTATPIRPEEVEMIAAMDDAYVSATREEQAAAMERARSKQ